jgi:hypothetical protein
VKRFEKLEVLPEKEDFKAGAKEGVVTEEISIKKQ